MLLTRDSASVLPRAVIATIQAQRGMVTRARNAPVSPSPDRALAPEQMLEGGTWKAGRAMAKKLRPDTCAPPIQIISDGTVF